MGIVFHELGRFEEAEPLFHRALKIAEASFGPDHPAVASDLNNLASFFKTPIATTRPSHSSATP